MNRAIEHLGNSAAALGILFCVIAGAARVTGLFYIVGFEVMTLFVVGMGLMLMACLAKLHLLSARAQESR
jgi:type IV secretory pathway VirB2 component (pilin)